jgi:NTP pyrophosphatase (non-canonical NTP hydrolase)
MASDRDTTIAELQKVLAKFITDRDWDRYHHPKEVAISLSVEASELLEIFQWAEKTKVEDIKNDPKLMEKIRDEVADVFGYTVDFASRLDIDVTKAFLDKMEKNRKKYPVEKSKGNHKKYTEL